MASRKATTGHQELMAMKKLTRNSRVPGFTSVTKGGKVWAKETAPTKATVPLKELRRKKRTNPELTAASVTNAVI